VQNHPQRLKYFLADSAYKRVVTTQESGATQTAFKRVGAARQSVLRHGEREASAAGHRNAPARPMHSSTFVGNGVHIPGRLASLVRRWTPCRVGCRWKRQLRLAEGWNRLISKTWNERLNANENYPTGIPFNHVVRHYVERGWTATNRRTMDKYIAIWFGRE